MPILHEFRVVLVVAGVVIATGGVIAAIVALRKEAPKGVAITGLALSGVIALVMSGFFALVLIEENRADALYQRAVEEAAAQRAEELAAEAAIFEKSEWLEDARANAKESDFVPVGATQLTAILNDPERHEGQGIIVDALMPAPLMAEAEEAEGLCMILTTLSPTDGSSLEYAAEVVMVDRGIPTHCEFFQGPVDREGATEELTDWAGEYRGESRVWLSMSGTTTVDGVDGIPLFHLIRVEE